MSLNAEQVHAVNLDFTDSAAKKVAELIAEENNPKLKLRVFITGGGCSGFQYGFTFDETQNSDDKVITKYVSFNDDNMSVQLLIDPMSYQYLTGSQIDFENQEIKGSQFVIRNPNAKTTCGCGSSFAV